MMMTCSRHIISFSFLVYSQWTVCSPSRPSQRFFLLVEVTKPVPTSRKFVVGASNCKKMKVFLVLQLALSLVAPSAAFSGIQSMVRVGTAKPSQVSPLFVSPASQYTLTYTPIFDFSNDKEDAASSFERIDDAIMGGISTSSLKQIPGEPFARWSGVCRTDGGGFCGARTLPFKEPLQVGDADGIYLLCQLTSDQEPERRVWKISTRSEQSRGEKLYQATYTLPKPSFDDWSQVIPITVPFTDFKLVSGPKMVVYGDALNATGGLYQIGLGLSKFQIAQNMTQLDNFRPGFFELQVKEIGVYKRQAESALTINTPATLSKEEMEKKRPLLLKIILPIAKIFFSEKSQRRKSAMGILRKRGLSRVDAILYGIIIRARSFGMAKSIGHTAFILLQDSFRSILSWAVRLGLFYPIRAVQKTTKAFSSLFRRQRGKAPSENDTSPTNN